MIKEYYETGELQKTDDRICGTGTVELYDREGTIRGSWKYIKGKKCGDTKIFNDDGSLQMHLFFENGELIHDYLNEKTNETIAYIKAAEMKKPTLLESVFDFIFR